MVLTAVGKEFYWSALKQCKPHQLVGIREVSDRRRRFLHRVIHTSVQNFNEREIFFVKFGRDCAHQEKLAATENSELSAMKGFTNG
jgi:hypothetical protein